MANKAEGIGIQYGYKAYAEPVAGLFGIDAGEWGVNGWVVRNDLITIIGETEDTYVYRLLETGHGEWVGEEVIEYEYVLPIGVHKSRLIRWEGIQLLLNF